MIIFDISFNTLKGMIHSGIGEFYFLEKPKSIEIYKPDGNGAMLRYTYYKKGDENDLIFYNTFMQRATEVNNIQTKSNSVIEVKSMKTNNDLLKALGNAVYHLTSEISDLKEKINVSNNG